MKIIVVDNLSKKFGQINAVDQIYFDVTEGEVFGFLGPKGAGKNLSVEGIAAKKKNGPFFCSTP